MIDVFVEYGRNTLHTEFPLVSGRLEQQLLSIGIRQDYIPARGNDTYKVTLEALDEAGEEVLSWLGETDSLHDVNFAACMVRRTCPYGYREFLDMLHPTEDGTYKFYQKFDKGEPTQKTGLEGLQDELDRYYFMMQEYKRVCDEEAAAQEAEEQGEDDEGWER